MAISMGANSRKGGTAMPTAISFGLGTAGVIITLWLAWTALTSDSVPVVGSVRGALIAIAVIGMASCAVAGVGQAPNVGWTHPMTIFGIAVGVVALAVIGAGLFGWDALVRPAQGVMPLGSAVVATTERLAVGLLAALIAVKWVAGIPYWLLINRT